MNVNGIAIREAFNFNGLNIVNSDEIIALIAGSKDGNSEICTPRKMDESTGYTPSGSKKFRIFGIKVICIVSAASSYMKLGYGDTDVGIESAAYPTNHKYIGDDGSNFVATLSDVGIYDIPLHNFEMPNGKYPFIEGISTAGYSCIIYGIEVD